MQPSFATLAAERPRLSRLGPCQWISGPWYRVVAALCEPIPAGAPLLDNQLVSKTEDVHRPAYQVRPCRRVRAPPGHHRGHEIVFGKGHIDRDCDIGKLGVELV